MKLPFGLSIQTALIIVAVIASLGVGTYLYFYVYNKGADAVTTRSLENYNKIEGKTNAAKTDALTTDTLDEQLRKYARPDDNK